MITLALSKGRIFDETLPLLAAAGIEVRAPASVVGVEAGAGLTAVGVEDLALGGPVARSGGAGDAGVHGVDDGTDFAAVDHQPRFRTKTVPAE